MSRFSLSLRIATFGVRVFGSVASFAPFFPLARAVFAGAAFGSSDLALVLGAAVLEFPVVVPDAVVLDAVVLDAVVLDAVFLVPVVFDAGLPFFSSITPLP
jgi:hypothetical protein